MSKMNIAFYSTNEVFAGEEKLKENDIECEIVPTPATDKEAAAAALLNATSVIDKATTKGVYHKNYASRKVSRLSKAVNQMA